MYATLQEQKVILALTDRLDFSAQQRLHAMVREGLAQGYTDFLLDLYHVSFIDGSGLRALLVCCTLVQQHGGRMALTRLPTRISELLELTHLAHFFEICDSTAVE